LKALASETKYFLSLSKLDGPSGRKPPLSPSEAPRLRMILQRHERGDYMITEKGYRALLGIAEVYAKLSV